MNKKIIILSIGLAYAINSGSSFAAPVTGDFLSITSVNGNNLASDYVSADSTNSYLTQSAITTDGNQTYNNNSLIQQYTTQTQALFQSRALIDDLVSQSTSGSSLDQNVDFTDSRTSLVSQWADTNGYSSLSQQNNSSSSMMNLGSSFNLNSATYVNQQSNATNARISMAASSNGVSNYLEIDSATGTSIRGALSVSGSTATNGITNTGSISTSSLTTSGNTGVGGNLSVSGSTTTNGITNTGSISTSSLTTSGNTSVGGDLSVTGNTTINGNLTIGGTTTFTGASTFANGLTVSGSVASFQSGASVSGGDLNMNSNRITNVAAGVSGTDAVNLNQLNAVSGQINDLSQKSYAGTASVAAIAGIPALQSDKNFNVGLGYGNFRGEDAIAIGGNARLTDTLSLKAAFASSRSEVTSSVGVGISF